MSNSVAFEKLSNMAKTKQKEIKEKEKEIKEKEKEEKDKKRQVIFDKLDRLFPTYKDIKAHAQDGKNKFSVVKFTDVHIGDNIHLLSFGKLNGNNYETNIDSSLVSYNEVYKYMKKKSISELGKPKWRKPGIFDRGFEIYYEW